MGGLSFFIVRSAKSNIPHAHVGWVKRWSKRSKVKMAWRQAISKNLKEVRIHLCQTSKSSQGVR